MSTQIIVRTTDELERARTAVEAVSRRIQVGDDDQVTITPALRRRTRQASLVKPRLSVRDRIRKVFGRLESAEEERRKTAFISAVVPAHNEQRDITATLEALLLQTRPIDEIVVVVNGSTDRTAEIVQAFADEFPETVKLVNNPTYTSRSGRQVEVRSKVAALNYFWHHYVAIEASRGSEEFVLGVDADVRLAPDAAQQLEQTLLDDMDDQQIGGVRAAYGFEVPESADFRTRGLIAAQQLDFAATELKDQLRRKGQVTILGGQGTLFRRTALERVSELNKGNGPWFAGTLVEDAYLTRQLEQLGYVGVVNHHARATVGAMTTPLALEKQRRKWQFGHLGDIATEKRPSDDRVRWGQQFALAWNALFRVAFFSLLLLALASHTFVFNPVWLIPLGLAILQEVLIVSLMKDRNAGLMVRAVTYILPEVHIWKTLAVWAMSLPKGLVAFLGAGKVDQSGWTDQYAAESSHRRFAWRTWRTIILGVLIPTVVMMALAYSFPFTTDYMLWWGWNVVAGMAIISSVFMAVKIVRIIKNYRRLSL